MNVLITEQEDIKPLLGTNWLREFKWMIQITEHATNKTDPTEKKTIKKLKAIQNGPKKTDTKTKLQMKHAVHQRNN